ncbi:hypothetical protein B0H14DRAFT_3445913 [Mycena olivaceomarginata]|nr:hypothetical protein B0H14DRAFT_3445913 [Mycena olivaceomarginata]
MCISGLHTRHLVPYLDSIGQPFLCQLLRPPVRRVSFLFAAIFTCARAYLYVCATSLPIDSFAAVFVHSHQLTPAHIFPSPIVSPAQMLPRIRALYRANSSIACVRTIATPLRALSQATPVPFVISLSIGNVDVPGPGMGVVRTSTA